MLSLLVTPHRPIYQALPTPQQAYLLLEALPENTPPAGEAQPVNLCLVLDRSGSMAGKKLQALKDAARQIVDRLGPADWLSVVIFDDIDPADLVIPAGPIQDALGVKRRIDAIQERGGTHMSTGMRLGLEQLRLGQSPSRVSQMVLLTDGQTWEDSPACLALADRCREAGFPIQVFGLGVGEQGNWDPQLLEELARRSGGEWSVIERPEQIAPLFKHTLQTVQDTAATHAQLTLRLVQGVTVRAIWRVTPLISRLDGGEAAESELQLFLGDIHYNEGQALLVDLLLPARPDGVYRLAQADIVYTDPAGGQTGLRSSADVVLRFTSHADETGPLNQQMMNLGERVVAHRLQTQA
ncbi:MAG: vWA domain-containing protein, partial [Chloroflexota bacterium]